MHARRVLTMDSWRRTGQGKQNQERGSGTNTPTKEGGRQQATSAVAGSAWGGKAKGAGPAPATQTSAEHHVPVREFNAGEVREFLKKSM
jgi:hypothetical protein